MSDASDRTFDPTPKRREDFRKQGRFPRSRDASGIASALAVVGALVVSRGPIERAATELFAHTWGGLHEREMAAAGVTQLTLGALLILTVPPLLAAAAAGALAGIAQAGLRLETSALELKLDRLNPLTRLLDVFAPKRGMIETALSLLRVGLVGYVTYRAIRLELPTLLGLAELPLRAGIETFLTATVRVVLTATVALGAVASADYLASYLRHEKDLKMTRQEVMDDARAEDGDPKAKARMRARARALTKKRALSNVKGADVIVTNPTHVAVALRYGDKDLAPIVVAKGEDDLALAIRREARKHGIPIVENRPLARALNASVPVGKAIPSNHFLAVAKILALVYRLKK